ncbi:MAG TPA: beta-galactosidase, partial [Phycisphaerae bacterium]|nr:beta-galactosidase [Phycisphaerae bacterium]
MNLGVQYYRPPFPVQRFWEDDFKKIADSGLNTVQLWILWSWVEPKPGEFHFDDYDRLVELAEKNGLGIVLSTIAEVQPYWIHREVPGSEMIDHMGRKVVSSNRGECHFGITPGGCIDNPGVWAGMKNFFNAAVSRYCKSPALRGWDAWNELRWNVNADGMVCFCEHTLAAFRKWLSDKYGGLDGLNKAWIRRYGCFDEVMPGKMCGRPYTEMMAFEHFLTWRANRHAKLRYDFIKSIDPQHPVLVHGGDPTILTYGCEYDHALNRGNDWFYADELDGIGCSSFPKWHGLDDADFGMRVECVKSAARNKKIWLSEVQGGRSSFGFNVYPAVDAASQQRWIWNGLACGADTILFWCWRDEVFGTESGGFGLSGRDGLAQERLDAMCKTGGILKDNATLFEHYKPFAGEVGIFFSPKSYYLCWGQEGNSLRMINAMMGYARSLVRNSIPYRFVEEEHLEELAGLKILFMPRTLVLDAKAEEAIGQFVRNGGTLVCESECGAFNSAGIYRYPEDRFVSTLTGISELDRRSLLKESISVDVNGSKLELPANQW